MTRVATLFTWGIVCLSSAALPGAVGAGEADVVDVKVAREGAGTYRFDVTVRHEDAGWNHYADRWEVVSVDGRTIFGTRTLFHPHEHEQPFTRSLGGVQVPDSVPRVVIRAHDSVHEFGGMETAVDLPR